MYGMVEALMELMSIPSITGNKEKCGEALDYMISKGESFGFSCKKNKKGTLAVIEMGEGEETLGIFTHVDVVDPCDLSKWTYDPFVPTVDSGRIFGRGAVDDKGAAIAVLFAMKDVWNIWYHRGIPFKKKIQLIVGSSAESDWSDIIEYKKTNELPDYGFAADGGFPICNIEKGSMDILISHPISDEDRSIMDISAGRAANIIPDRCTITLSNERKFAAKGRAARSTYPDRGANAMIGMAQALDSLTGQDRIQISRDPIFKIINKYKKCFEDAKGLLGGMPQSTNYYKSEYVGENTYVPTLAYIKDGRLFIDLNVRYTCDTKEEDIVSAVENLFDDDGIIIEKIDSFPPMFESRNKPYIKAFAEAYEGVTGLKNTFSLNSGATYAKLFDNVVVWGPILPDHGDTGHQEDEFISVRDLTIIESVYERVFEEMAFSEESYK